MLRLTVVGLLMFTWTVCFTLPGYADSPTRVSARAVIDRVELEPSPLWGFDRLRVLLSAQTVQGGQVDLTAPKSIHLIIGESEKKVPMIVGRFGNTTLPLALAVVVQTSSDMADVSPLVREGIETQLLPSLESHSQVIFIGYGDAVNTGKAVVPKNASSQLDRIASDGSSGDPGLLEGIERALISLRKVKPSNARKVLIIVGDGRDRDNDHLKVTAMGERAKKENVRILSIGFAPSGLRRSLLSLGELSKQSLGTFRWVRTPQRESWQPVFAQLAAEISKQYVVTFLVENDSMAGKKIRIDTSGAATLSSNEMKVPQAKCGDSSCENGDACIAGSCHALATGQKRKFGGVLLAVVMGLLAIGLLAMLAKLRRRPAHASPVVAPAAVVAASAPAPVVAVRNKTMLVVVDAPAKSAAVSAPAPAAMAPRTAAAAPSVPQPAARAPAAPPATLYFLGGPRMGQRMALHHGFVIGSASHCNLVLQDADVAPQHAEIHLDNYGNCAIVDRNSATGIYVGGVRVRSAALSHGSSIRIGATDFRYLAE
jgi:hypothetical protein